MRRPVVYSLLFHLVIGTLISVSLISNRPVVVTEEPIAVELVPFADRPNPPPVTERARELQAAKPAPPAPTPPQPEPRAEAKAVPEPTPPKPPEPKPVEPKVAARTEPPPPVRPPEPVREPPSTPKPEAKPAPKVEPKFVEPKPAPPKPEPKAVAKPEPEPQPKAEPRPKPTEVKADVPKPDAPKPEVPKQQTKAPQPAKPTEVKATAPSAKSEKPAEKTAEKPKESEAADFASVMKTVEGLKRQPSSSDSKPAKPAPPAAEKSKDAGDGNFSAQMAQALRSAGPTEHNTSLPVTQSEIDAVRRQIEQCWNLPAGAKDAGNLVVSIRVEMNSDGTPRSAVVQSSGQQNNPFYQAAAESARRAVLNPRCHPFKLPPDKYDRWRTMTLIFNPKDMAGT